MDIDLLFSRIEEKASGLLNLLVNYYSLVLISILHFDVDLKNHKKERKASDHTITNLKKDTGTSIRDLQNIIKDSRDKWRKMLARNKSK